MTEFEWGWLSSNRGKTEDITLRCGTLYINSFIFLNKFKFYHNFIWLFAVIPCQYFEFRVENILYHYTYSTTKITDISQNGFDVGIVVVRWNPTAYHTHNMLDNFVSLLTSIGHILAMRCLLLWSKSKMV